MISWALALPLVWGLGVAPGWAGPVDGGRGIEAVERGGPVVPVERYLAVLFSAHDYGPASGLADLASPAEDIRRLGQVLETRYGFEVELVDNATEAQIVAHLERLKAETTDRDAVFLYYAGHGTFDTDEQRGYWLPSDASLTHSSRWVSNDDVAAKTRAMQARHVLLVVDSCFSGTFRNAEEPTTPTEASDSHTVQALASKRSRWVMSSGGNEPVSDGGFDGMSVFAYHFVTMLDRADDTFVVPNALFPQVRERVTRDADQIPQQGGFRRAYHDDGQFVMVRRVPPPSRVPPPAPSVPPGPTPPSTRWSGRPPG